MIRATNKTRGAALIERGRAATGHRDRMRGLLGCPGLDPGEGLMIAPCQSVHTFFMRFPIDVVYVDRGSKVVGLAPELKPNRVGPMVLRARFVLELPAGTIGRTGTRLGDELEVQDEDEG